MLLRSDSESVLVLQTSFDDMPEAYKEGLSYQRSELARPALTRLASHFSLSCGLQEAPSSSALAFSLA